jgi:hypothetical protein
VKVASLGSRPQGVNKVNELFGRRVSVGARNPAATPITLSANLSDNVGKHAVYAFLRIGNPVTARLPATTLSWGTRLGYAVEGRV